jgi:hypothetical protein
MQVINQAGQSLDGSGVNVGYGPEIITDITIDHNLFTHAGKGPLLAALNSGLGLHRVAITNNVFDDTNYQRWGHGRLTVGFSSFEAAGTANSAVQGWTSPATPVTDNVTFNHNTLVGLQQNPIQTFNHNTQFKMIGLNIQNSIIAADGSASFVNGNGEGSDCLTGSGSSNTEATALASCWAPYQFNYLALTNSTASPSIFISSPLWQPAATATDLFANYNGGKDGDYRVCTGLGAPTAGCTAGTYAAGGARQALDGTALGADMVGVNAAVAAVHLGTRTP